MLLLLHEMSLLGHSVNIDAANKKNWLDDFNVDLTQVLGSCCVPQGWVNSNA